MVAEQALGLYEKILLGKENPYTLTSMNNLALVLNGQGKYKEAEEVNRWTLELKEMVLGREHLDTLMSIHNLVTVLGRQGQVPGGRGDEPSHRRTL